MAKSIPKVRITMTRIDFLREIEEKFPEAFLTIDTTNELLHCEISDFRSWLESQMKLGAAWKCQKVFEFILHSLNNADSELENAIEVSFITDLALGEHMPEYKLIIEDRAPAEIRRKLTAIHEFWK